MRIQESYYDDNGDLHWADAVVGEEKDYAVDWSERMTNEGDTLQSITWTIPDGLTEVDTDLTDDLATIWLTADTVGTHEIKCQANTVDSGANQIYIRKILLKVI